MSSIRYDDVADLYDLHVKVDFDIPFFLSEAQKTPGKVLELMAGTGRVSVPLVEAGVDLTCVDVSNAMLERLRAKLRAKGLSAEVHQGDVRELNLGERFGLVIIPFHSFSELVARKDQVSALGAAARHIEAAGRLICTLQNPSVRLQQADGALRLTGSYEIESGRLVVSGFERHDPRTNIVSRTQLYELFGEDGLMESKHLLEMRFCLIGPSEFETIAAEVGLRLDALYGNYNYADFDEEHSPFMIWVLKSK
jgi:SAM-dependent methyltransferase